MRMEKRVVREETAKMVQMEHRPEMSVKCRMQQKWMENAMWCKEKYKIRKEREMYPLQWQLLQQPEIWYTAAMEVCERLQIHSEGC